MSNIVEKLINNKFFLFLISNLPYLTFLLYVYNANFVGQNNGQILFYEILFLFFLTVFINYIICSFLYRILKGNIHKVFFIDIVLSNLFINPNIYLLCFIIMLIIINKLFTGVNFKYLVNFLVYFSIFVFSFNFATTGYFLYYTATKSRSFDNNVPINVIDEIDTPNIYWIHCDAMLGMDVMDKYYYYDNDKIKKYFNQKGYDYNENARLVVGYGTRRSLPALFNPYYYDNFYKNFLLDLENVFLEKKILTDELVNYYELRDKRLSNELFRALKEKNYVTYGVGSFDQYTSLYTDYYYDYYNNDYRKSNFEGKLKLLDYSTNKRKFDYYISFVHSSSLISNSYLKDFISYNKMDFLKGNVIDYNDIDLSNYNYANSTDYAPIRAIFKSLEDINKNDCNKFVFVDYYLNHLPLIYNSAGDRIDSNHGYNLSFYSGNYIYSVNLLIDMLDYIHNNDKNAIIIVQADHGINIGSDEYIMNLFDIGNEDVQEIRNSVINAVYVPDKYKNGYEKYLGNPLNISRYIVNSYVGYNYEYIEDEVR